MSQLYPYQGSVSLVHNHPSSSSLSYADLNFSLHPSIKQIVAIGHDGTQYMGKALIDIDDFRELNSTVRNRLVPHAQTMYHQHADMTSSDLNRVFSHLHNAAFERVGAIEYSMTNASEKLLNLFDKVGKVEQEAIISDVIKGLT